jgi:uncharacterized membrane protein YkoI
MRSLLGQAPAARPGFRRVMWSMLCLVLATQAFAMPPLVRDRPNECLAPQEIRDAIADNKLIRPVKAMKSASLQFNAEALGIKLCRQGGDFIYEIALLQRDGRVMRAFLNAATGDVVAVRNNR